MMLAREYRTIPEARMGLARECVERGYMQIIQRGSFEGGDTVRFQLPFVACSISAPLDFLCMPSHMTVGVIQQYYADYLIGTSKAEGEDYTYGMRIGSQLEKVLEMLRQTPYTNQAAICVSSPDDVDIEYPACLREITFKVVHGVLNLTSYWRSNDVLEGFPMNQGGMALMLQDAANYAGLGVGKLFVCSDGMHVYDYSRR